MLSPGGTRRTASDGSSCTLYPYVVQTVVSVCSTNSAVYIIIIIMIT